MSTKTPNITLSKPGFLGEHWGPEFNANWDILDTLLGPAGHDILATHKYTGGAALDLIGLSAPSTLALISPSSSPSGSSRILKSDGAGALALHQLTLTALTGTAPLVITSTTVVTNLNADKLDGYDASAFQAAGSYVTSVAGTAPIVSSGTTTPTISITGVDATHAGAVPLSGTPATNQYLRSAQTTGVVAWARPTWADIDKSTSSLADITTRSHTVLADIGTNSHSAIDTHIGSGDAHSASSNPGAASAMLKSDASGQLTLVNLLANTTTFNLVNATATTINLAGAATTINVGAASCVVNGAGGLTLNGGIAANDDITIQGTSHATRTSSYVLLQPNGGNVGIGTATPTKQLEVQQDVNSGVTIRARNDTDGSGAQATIAASLGDWTHYTSINTYAASYASSGLIKANSGALFSSGNTAGLAIATLDAYDLTLGTNNAANVTIKNGGNVGIGTTGPDRKLDVLDASNPQLRLTHTDGTVYTDFQTDQYGALNVLPSGNYMILGSVGVLHAGASNFELFGYPNKGLSLGAHNAVDKLVIATSGKVGINATDPAEMLYVNGNVRIIGTATNALQFENAVSGTRFHYIIPQYDASVDNNNRLDFSVSTHTPGANTAVMSLTGAGNVGIGTTGPGASLDIVGANDVSAKPQLWLRQASGGLYGTQLNLDATALTGGRQWRLFSSAGTAAEGQGKFIISDTGTVRVTVDNAGNVGINTTGAAAKLAINGGCNVGADTDPGDNNLYVVGDTSSLTFTDRTPYPLDLAEAWAAVMSVRAKVGGGVDHKALHPSLQSGEGRNLSALVSAQNLVIQDLQARVARLERKAA